MYSQANSRNIDVLPVQIIAQKRDGLELSESMIADFVASYATEQIPDYQMSAFAMAVFLNGMTAAETTALTRAMLESGCRLSWPNDGICRVDKHSTGGVGDKVSLPLAPLLASLGVQVPMLSGRGLGPTGGTLDKLESIAGYRTDLGLEEIQQQVQRIGCVITGASAELAPADRRLYALRDVTATVPSIPLITASIMSKKLAESPDALVLDVKFGSGAFMKTMEHARQLAGSLVSTGRLMGVPTTALLTDMNQPLGRMCGNALEVEESLAVLRGEGPTDVRELTLQLAAEILVTAGMASDITSAAEQARSALDSGSAMERFAFMVSAQGGRLQEERHLASSSDIVAERDGAISAIDVEAIGWTIISMGGGRRQLTDPIDHGVGVEMLVRIGDVVESGQPILRQYTTDPQQFEADLLNSIHMSDSAEPLPLIVDRISGDPA